MQAPGGVMAAFGADLARIKRISPRNRTTIRNGKWDAECIKYLGVTLAKDFYKMFDLNYRPLNLRIKSDIQRWNVIPFLSLSSRIESIRTNVLSRMLYLFQGLPVSIPPKQFLDWDRLILRNIWQGKRAGIKHKTLQSRKGWNGSFLPTRIYYAVQLRPLVCLCSPTYTARCKEKEAMMIKEIPLTGLSADSKLQGELMVSDDPMLDIPLKSWQEIVKI